MVGANTLGQFEGSIIYAPVATTSTIAIEPYMQISAPEETSGSTPPWWRVKVSYQEIETTQEGADIAAALLPISKNFMAKSVASLLLLTLQLRRAILWQLMALNYQGFWSPRPLLPRWHNLCLKSTKCHGAHGPRVSALERAVSIGGLFQ